MELTKKEILFKIKYYYNIDFEIACNYFDIIKKNISSKNIDFIIENKLFKLLHNLIGRFVSTSHTEFIKTNDELDLYYIDNESRNNHINTLELMLSNDLLDKINNFNYDYNFIVDGGNILHSKNGNITDHSVNILFNIINKLDKPVLVIHQKYLKNIPKFINKLEENNIIYISTPYNFDDDIFILLLFFKKYNTFIISNDKFRDYIFKLKDNELYNIFKQHIINYTDFTLNDKPTYSKCIQYKNNKFYIPHIDNYFIEILD
jgi:hypothetical protein